MRAVYCLLLVTMTGCVNASDYLFVMMDGFGSTTVRQVDGRIVAHWSLDRIKNRLGVKQANCTNDGRLVLARYLGPYGADGCIEIRDVYSGALLERLDGRFLACEWSNDGAQIAALRERGFEPDDLTYELVIYEGDLTEARKTVLSIQKRRPIMNYWRVSWNASDRLIAISEHLMRTDAQSNVFDTSTGEINCYRLASMRFVGDDIVVAYDARHRGVWLAQISDGDSRLLRRVSWGSHSASDARSGVFAISTHGPLWNPKGQRVALYNVSGHLPQRMPGSFPGGLVCMFVPESHTIRATPGAVP